VLLHTVKLESTFHITENYMKLKETFINLYPTQFDIHLLLTLQMFN